MKAAGGNDRIIIFQGPIARLRLGEQVVFLTDLGSLKALSEALLSGLILASSKK